MDNSANENEIAEATANPQQEQQQSQEQSLPSETPVEETLRTDGPSGEKPSESVVESSLEPEEFEVPANIAPAAINAELPAPKVSDDIHEQFKFNIPEEPAASETHDEPIIKETANIDVDESKSQEPLPDVFPEPTNDDEMDVDVEEVQPALDPMETEVDQIPETELPVVDAEPPIDNGTESAEPAPIVTNEEIALIPQSVVPAEGAVSGSNDGFNEDFISTNDDIHSVSAFFSIPIELLESNKDLFVSLMIKLNEFEKLKSSSNFVEINYEQLQHTHKKKMEIAKNELVAASKEIETLVNNQKKLAEEKEQLESTLRNVSCENNKTSKSSNDMKLKIAELEKSNTDISELLESKQDQVNLLNKEIKSLLEENKTVRKSVLDIESSKEELNSNVMQYKFEITKLERENKILTDSRNWFETELQSATAEFEQYRTKQSSKFTAVSNELNTLKQNYEISQASLKNYSAEVTRLSTKNDEQQFQIKEFSDKVETQENQFMEQISKRDEHIQVLEKANKDKAQRITSLDRLYEETTDKVKADEEEYEKLFKDMEGQLVSKDVRIEELESLVSDLNAKDTKIDGTGFQISSFAQKTLKTMNSELSLTDLITELNNLRKEVVKEKRAKVKAETDLCTVLKQLELKWPVLESYKDKCEDYEKKEEKIKVMLDNLTSDKTTLSKNCDMLKKKVSESQMQIRNLTKYKIDLQRQLVILLTEIQYKGSGERSLTLEEKDYINKIVSSYGEIRDVDDTDTDKLITSRLTTFRNTTDLIKQNEKLLSVSRKLGEDLENKETNGDRFIDEVENSTIQKAKEAIAKLQQNVKALETQLQAAVNSRDILQNLFDSGAATVGNKKDNEVNSERISSLLDELKSKKEELAEIRKSYDTRIFELNSKVQAVTSEKSEISLQLSKEKSTGELNKEKADNLQYSVDFVKKENEQLKTMLEKSQNNLNKLESNIQKANDSMLENRSSVVELEIKVKSLSAEKNVWKSVEDQLRTDITKLYNEKAESNKMIVQLQTLDAERQAHFKESVQRYTNTTESLQREIDSLREKLDKCNAEISNILHAKNVDAKVYQQRIDLLVEDSSIIKSTLAAKEKAISELTEELSVLKKKHASIDERKQSVLTTIANSSGSSDDNIVLAEELRHALEDLDSAVKDAAQYKELSTATEQQLASLNETHQQYKTVAEEKIGSLSETVESLKVDVAKLEGERDGLKQEVESSKYDSELAKQELTSKVEELNSSISTFDAIKEDYENKLAVVKSEVESKTKIIEDLHSLIADKTTDFHTNETIHNIVVKERDDLKSRIAIIEGQISEIEGLLKEEREKNKESISKFEQDVRNAKIRISELETQNRTLLNQLEESPLAFNESDDMKGLITYLNREKDSLTQQLQYVQGEESILRQTIISKEKEIAELKSELIIVKEKSSTIDKYSDALAKMKGEVEELRVYKENNSVLREQAKIYEGKIGEYGSKVAELTAKLNPLQLQLVNFKSVVVGKETQIAQLNSQIAALNNQLQQSSVVSSESSEKDVQIVELQSKYDERTQTLEKLKNQFNDIIKKVRAERQQATDEAKELAVKVEELQKQLESVKSETKGDNEDVEKLKSQIRILKEELHQKTIENSNIVKVSSEKVNAVNDKLASLKKEYDESRSSTGTPSADLVAMEQQFKQKEEALKKLELELKSKSAVNGGDSSAELEEFKKQLKADNLVQLNKEIEAHKIKIRAPSQAKITEIVEKRIKAKTEELEKIHADRMKELEATSGGSGGDFTKEKEELLKTFEAEKEQLKKEVRSAVEKEKEFKEKFLQGKIARLEEQVKTLEEKKKSSTVATPSPVPAFNKGSSAGLPATPNMPNMQNMPMMNFGQMPNMFGNVSAFNPTFNTNANPFMNSNANNSNNGNKSAFNFKPNNNNSNNSNSSSIPSMPAKRSMNDSKEPDKRTKTE